MPLQLIEFSLEIFFSIICPGLLFRPIYKYVLERNILTNPNHNIIFAAFITIIIFISGFISVFHQSFFNYINNKESESAVALQSIKCSEKGCGAPSCIELYTSKFPSGTKFVQVMVAAYRAQRAPQCLTPTSYPPPNLPKKPDAVIPNEPSSRPAAQIPGDNFSYLLKDSFPRRPTPQFVENEIAQLSGAIISMSKEGKCGSAHKYMNKANELLDRANIDIRFDHDNHTPIEKNIQEDVAEGLRESIDCKIRTSSAVASFCQKRADDVGIKIQPDQHYEQGIERANFVRRCTEAVQIGTDDYPNWAYEPDNR